MMQLLLQACFVSCKWGHKRAGDSCLGNRVHILQLPGNNQYSCAVAHNLAAGHVEGRGDLV